MEDQLALFLEDKCGRLEDLKFVSHKGFAVATFVNPADATKAKKYGRTLRFGNRNIWFDDMWGEKNEPQQPQHQQQQQNNNQENNQQHQQQQQPTKRARADQFLEENFDNKKRAKVALITLSNLDALLGPTIVNCYYASSTNKHLY